MQYWLNVFFLINGVWIPGQQFDGWAPRAFPTEATCLERKAFAERQGCEKPLDVPATWICSAAEPLREVPEFLKGREC